MRKPIFIALMLLFACVVNAQVRSDCERHYFKGGKLSTSACYEKGSSFGHAKAYNRAGVMIFEKDIRKIGGHAYVIFDHYASGAVKRAEWHSAPDAGIQWYSSVTTFAEDGKVLSYTESNYDDHNHITAPTQPAPQPKKPEKPQKQQVVECAVIYSSELWFINNTGYTITVHADRLYRKEETYKVSIAPGDTAQCGYLILAQQFANPNTYFSTWAESAKKGQHPGIAYLRDVPVPESKEKHRYYFTVQ